MNIAKDLTKKIWEWRFQIIDYGPGVIILIVAILLLLWYALSR